MSDVLHSAREVALGARRKRQRTIVTLSIVGAIVIAIGILYGQYTRADATARMRLNMFAVYYNHVNHEYPPTGDPAVAWRNMRTDVLDVRDYCVGDFNFASPPPDSAGEVVVSGHLSANPRCWIPFLR